MFERYWVYDHILSYYCADATIYVGGLDEKVSENILWEMFLQAGPIGVYITNAERYKLRTMNYSWLRELQLASNAVLQ